MYIKISLYNDDNTKAMGRDSHINLQAKEALQDLLLAEQEVVFLKGHRSEWQQLN